VYAPKLGPTLEPARRSAATPTTTPTPTHANAARATAHQRATTYSRLKGARTEPSRLYRAGSAPALPSLRSPPPDITCSSTWSADFDAMGRAEKEGRVSAARKHERAARGDEHVGRATDRRPRDDALACVERTRARATGGNPSKRNICPAASRSLPLCRRPGVARPAECEPAFRTPSSDRLLMNPRWKLLLSVTAPRARARAHP